ncbi:MAG: hypothetical protein J0L64_01630 [Acidobacteria bacterium]|nr:hypothetical protein [Acidobacteriota bacterium]
MPAALGAAVFFAIWNPFETVDHAAWERDLDILLADLSRGHANLDWLAATGRVNPPQLAAAARRGLREASSNRAARAVLYEFVDGFHDPHLRIEGRRNWLPGFLRKRRRLEIDYRGEGYTALPAGVFEAGLLALGQGSTAGVIRIERFGHETYGDVMRAVNNDDERAMRLLVERLHERVGEIERRGARVLLVDITGNGGGTDWADGAARLLSPKPLHYGGVGFVRHPHHTSTLPSQRAMLQRDLARTDLRPEQRALLERALAEQSRLEQEVAVNCDRSQVWTTGTAACSSLIRRPGGGLAGYVPPGVVAGLESAPALFGEENLRVREGAWTGPVAILMDGRTASASEQFAALLRDNGAAVLLGQRSLGAGCGYINGGIQSRLPHSGLVVKMPDCARFRANGENEIAGLEPDVPLASAAELRQTLSRLARGNLRPDPAAAPTPPPAPAQP